MSRAGFLDRWSARKREQADRAADPTPETPAPVDDAQAGEAQDAGPSLSEEAAAQMTDAEALAALRLPDPTSLSHGADFTAFLRAGVPKRLQRMALRRLWTVTPAQAALDGLVDYAEDYTDAAVAVETLATTYQVGRGLRAHTEALARAEEKAAQDTADPGEDEPADTDAAAQQTDVARAETAETPVEAGAAPPCVADAVAPATHVPEAPQPGETRSPGLRTSRRMAFRFDDA